MRGRPEKKRDEMRCKDRHMGIGGIRRIENSQKPVLITVALHARCLFHCSMIENSLKTTKLYKLHRLGSENVPYATFSSGAAVCQPASNSLISCLQAPIYTRRLDALEGDRQKRGGRVPSLPWDGQSASLTLTHHRSPL